MRLPPFFQVERRARARNQLSALAEDAAVLAGVARRAGKPHPRLAALGDPSLPALALLRSAAALRALVGTSLGVSRVLSTVFHIDVWSDDIGGGLRLPHPFQIVIGEGVAMGRRCTVLHNVTVQRGERTRVGEGAVLGTGAVVLAGANVGERAVIGANSVVRGAIAPDCVAVGAPARVVRSARAEEVRS